MKHLLIFLAAFATSCSANLTRASAQVQTKSKPQSKLSVAFVSPSNGQSLSGSFNVVVSAISSATVERVELFIDQSSLGTSSTPTANGYSFTFNTLAQLNGVHTLKAIATAPADVTASTSVSVTINNSISNPSDPMDPHPPVDPVVGVSFCDAAAWNGTTPSSSTDLVVAKGSTVVLDCDAITRKLTINEGGIVIASRTKSSSLTAFGNIVVRGTLDLGRANDRVQPGVRSEVIFKGMNNANYKGTPTKADVVTTNTYPRTTMTVVDSDVGLWVVGSGLFTAAGQVKKSWSFLTEGAGPQDSNFTVEDATGWLGGDLIVLTPTEAPTVANHFAHFDERTINTLNANAVTLSASPQYVHSGCSNCVKRGEAINLTRNVVVRSFDSSNRAHMMVAELGVVQLDSVELRWLGPASPSSDSDLMRRAPLFFHQQEKFPNYDSPSTVRHVSIWGSAKDFIDIEQTDGIELQDIAGYDARANGFNSEVTAAFWNDNCPYALPKRCDLEQHYQSRNIVWNDLIAAKVSATKQSRYAGGAIWINRAEGSGCNRCVAVGVTGSDGFAGFWTQVNSENAPSSFMKDIFSHNNSVDGLGSHAQSDLAQSAPWQNLQLWHNGGSGYRLWGYIDCFASSGLVSIDNNSDGVLQAAAPLCPLRLKDSTIDNFYIGGYTLPQTTPAVLDHITFTNVAKRAAAVAQENRPCSGGNENDPDDRSCLRNWHKFISPRFPAGIKPFLFGFTENKTSVWEVTDFVSADSTYSSLPKNFALYRKDNQVSGGCVYAPFDAWMVPCP